MTERVPLRPFFLSALILAVLLLLGLVLPAKARAEAPAGQLTWAVHISLAPGWFDPAETTGIITPFMLLYALHDALVKPMPGNPMAPSLAESWTMSPDGLSYEFVLRRGVKFHNGEPVTAEDVKFSMERYRGAASGPYKARMASIDVSGIRLDLDHEPRLLGSLRGLEADGALSAGNYRDWASAFRASR